MKLIRISPLCAKGQTCTLWNSFPSHTCKRTRSLPQHLTCKCWRQHNVEAHGKPLAKTRARALRGHIGICTRIYLKLFLIQDLPWSSRSRSRMIPNPLKIFLGHTQTKSRCLHNIHTDFIQIWALLGPFICEVLLGPLCSFAFKSKKAPNKKVIFQKQNWS